MPPLTNDPVISPATALGMGEHLVTLLNTVLQNLPERELRRLLPALERSVCLADELINNLSVSSNFDLLTINQGARI